MRSADRTVFGESHTVPDDFYELIFMERQKSISQNGKENYYAVKKNIPDGYLGYVDGEDYVKGGKVYERLLEKILKGVFVTLKDEKLRNSSALIPIKREGKIAGYVRPDLKLCHGYTSVFIEVTGWADSNMIFSKIMQGYLLKKKQPEAKYYVVIADLGIDDGWSWDDRPDWKKWSIVESVTAVDGWFGFKDINGLIQELKNIGF